MINDYTNSHSDSNSSNDHTNNHNNDNNNNNNTNNSDKRPLADTAEAVREIASALDRHLPDTLVFDEPCRRLGASAAAECLQNARRRQVRLVCTFCGTLEDLGKGQIGVSANGGAANSYF